MEKKERKIKIDQIQPQLNIQDQQISYKKNLIITQSEADDTYYKVYLTSNLNERLYSQNGKYFIQLNNQCKFQVYEVQTIGLLEKKESLFQTISLQNLDYSKLNKEFQEPYKFSYDCNDYFKEEKMYNFNKSLIIIDNNKKTIWREKQEIKPFFFQIITNSGQFQLNNVQCYYDSTLYYSSAFGFSESLNIFFTEQYEQLSPNAKTKFIINQEIGCLEILKLIDGQWKSHWKSHKFDKNNFNIENYKKQMQELDVRISQQIEIDKQQEENDTNNDNNKNNNKDKYRLSEQELKIDDDQTIPEQGLTEQQKKQLLKIEYYHDHGYEDQKDVQENIKGYKNYYFRLKSTSYSLKVEDRLGNVIWEHDLGRRHQDDMIQIQNSGNLAIKNYDYEVRWQTFTGGLKQRLLYFFEQFLETVLDPVLFFGDTYSDIFLLIAFYSQGHYNYFATLLTCMILDRIAQFIFLIHLISSSSIYDYFEVKPISCFTYIHKKLDKAIYALSAFVYLDPLLDSYFSRYGERQAKRIIRKFIECILEALPSMFLNIHSIFFQLQEEDNVHYMQYIALGFSLLNSCKSLFEIKVFMNHGGSWQKLLGPQGYEQGNSSIRASIQSFFMIFVFLLTYSYSFGVFTDITRPYGIIFYISITYGICFLVNFVICTRFYFINFTKQCYDTCEKFLYFILLYILCLPLATCFMTVIVALGAYVDWALDFKNDPVEKEGTFGLYWFLSYIRIGFSILFLVTYINEDNYEYTTFGFLIYTHVIYNVLYHIILLIQIKRKLGFARACKGLKEVIEDIK